MVQRRRKSSLIVIRDQFGGQKQNAVRRRDSKLDEKHELVRAKIFQAKCIKRTFAAVSSTILLLLLRSVPLPNFKKRQSCHAA